MYVNPQTVFEHSNALVILLLSIVLLDICICDALRDFVPFAQFKKCENTHAGVLLLVSFRPNPATFLKVTLLHGCFSRFLSFTNGTKSRKQSVSFVFNF